MRGGRTVLDRLRETVQAAEPGARVILYGSRARGDARPDSDWDLLILLDGPVDERRADAVRDRLFDLGLELGAVLTAIVRSRTEWESPRWRSMPFHVSVSRDGVEV